MPNMTGSLLLPAVRTSGVLSVPQPNPGPNTRQSTINIEVVFGGDYWDELNGKVTDKISWKADGFKPAPDRPGFSAGQSNRFWFNEGLQIQSGGHVDVDLYSFLTVDGGMGIGQDQLGLPLVMHQITELYLINRSGSGLLTIGGADYAPWTSLLTGRKSLPGATRWLNYTRADPAWVVTRGSSQYLRLAASGGSCTIDIYIAGRYVVP